MQRFMQCHKIDHKNIDQESVDHHFFWHLWNPCQEITRLKFFHDIGPQIVRLSCVSYQICVLVHSSDCGRHSSGVSFSTQGKTVHCTSTKIRGYRAGQGGQSIGGLGKIPRMQISAIVIFAEPRFVVFLVLPTSSKMNLPMQTCRQ